MAVELEAPNARATARYQHVSPYKVRQVLDLVRGLSVEDAERTLQLCEKDAADDVLKVLESAIANAEHNFHLAADELYLAVAYADEGPTRKWGQPRARGRYFRVRKRTSHITLIVARYDEDELEERRRRDESSGRGSAVAQRRRAERVRRSRRQQQQEAAHDHDHDHDHGHDDDELIDDPTAMAGEIEEASEGDYPGAGAAEPTEGEAEPGATSQIDVEDAIEEEEVAEADADEEPAAETEEEEPK
jgi:large subunit ribosomal protein L22